MKSRNLFLSSAMILSILFVGCANTSSSASSENGVSNDTSSSESSSSSSNNDDEQTKLNLADLKKHINTKADDKITSMSFSQTVEDMFTTGMYGNLYLTEIGYLNACYKEDSITSTEVEYNIYDNDVSSYKSKSYQESLLYYVRKSNSFNEKKKISDYEITQYYDDNNKMYVTMEDNYNTKNSDSGASKYRKDGLVGQGYRTFKAQSDYVLETAGYSIPDLNTQFLNYATEKYTAASEYTLSVEQYGDGEIGEGFAVKLTTREDSSLYQLYSNIEKYYSNYFLDSKVAILTEIDAEFDIVDDGNGGKQYQISYMTVDDAYQILEDPYIGYENTGANIESKNLYLYETEVYYDNINYGTLGEDGEKKVASEIPGLSEKLTKINEIKTNAETIDATATSGNMTQTINHSLMGAIYHDEDVAFEKEYGIPLSDFTGSRTLTSESIHYADGYVVTNAHDVRNHYNFDSTPITMDNIIANNGKVDNGWGEYYLVFTADDTKTTTALDSNKKSYITHSEGSLSKMVETGEGDSKTTTAEVTYNYSYDYSTKTYTITDQTSGNTVCTFTTNGSKLVCSDKTLFSGDFTLTGVKKSYDMEYGTVASEDYHYTTTLHSDASGNVIAGMTSDDNPNMQLSDYTLYTYSTLYNNGYTADSYLAGVVGCNTLLYNYLYNYYVKTADATCEFTTNTDGTTSITMDSKYYTTFEVVAQLLEDTSTDYYDQFTIDPLCQAHVVLNATLDSQGRVTSLEVTGTYYALETYANVAYETPVEIGSKHFVQTVGYDSVGNYKDATVTAA